MRIDGARWSAAAVLAFGFLLAAGPASANTLHVTSGADSGPGTLRQAVAEAQPSGDTIVIDPGVPKVGVLTPIGIDKSLTIQGQGAGVTEVVSAALAGSRIFEVGTVTQGISVRIEALKISGGRAPAGIHGPSEGGGPGPGSSPPGPGGPGGDGGAILNKATRLDLVGLTLSENAAGNGGGGGDAPTASFPPGPGGAGGGGGAIANSGTMTIASSTLVGNSSGAGGFPGFTPSSFAPTPSGLAGEGGAIVNSGTMAIVDSTISNNHAAAGNNGGSPPSGFGEPGNAGGNGGAVRSTGTLTLTRSTLSGNVAGTGGIGGSGITISGFGGQGGSGGALYLNGGTALITNSTFSGNSTGKGGGGGGFGGGMGAPGGSGGSGGAIMVTGGAKVTVAASTLSSNGTGKGGAGGPGSPAGPSGSEGGGGGVSEVLSGLTIRGSVLASNIGIGGSCSGLAGGNGGGNLVFPEAGSCTGFPVGDPKLDPAGLAGNGGPTQTIALQPGSAAFNLVPTASCTDAAGAPLTVDQRGEPRPQFGACDAGAYEVAEPKKPKSTTAAKVKLTKTPKKTVKTKKKRAEVKFAFISDVSSAHFECALTAQRKAKGKAKAPPKPSFSACSSPKSYSLKPGRYVFEVRAIAAGGTGPTESYSFKVKKTKKKGPHKRRR